MDKEEKRLYCRDLIKQYRERFGKSFSVPFIAFTWKEEDTIREILYSLETGIPFDPDSPRWQWETIDDLNGAII
ncbi:hypothetical protein AALA21_00985 [Eggerthellaceae bacterium 3-80]|nr:hypothetical protein D7W09_01330 [bacterium D16-34]